MTKRHTNPGTEHYNNSYQRSFIRAMDTPLFYFYGQPQSFRNGGFLSYDRLFITRRQRYGVMGRLHVSLYGTFDIPSLRNRERAGTLVLHGYGPDRRNSYGHTYARYDGHKEGKVMEGLDPTTLDRILGYLSHKALDLSNHCYV